MNEWSDWGSCSKTCGGGNQYRTRTYTPPQYGGLECDYSSESRPCNTDYCPIDCYESEWSDWGSCSKTCGDGHQYRTRTMTPPQYGGRECGYSSESQQCNEGYCPVDCYEGEWSDWGSCSKTCGDGMSYRTRTVTPPQYGGRECGHSSDGRQCTNGYCPVVCEYSQWSNWNQCSRSCGTGYQSRTRRALNYADRCTETSATRPCNTKGCGY